MGLEGKDSQYGKLNDIDTISFVRMLQDHGIRVLGSSIIGLDEHTPENISEAIEHAVSHVTDFHQFMLYTPVPGTPLHAEHEAKGTLRDPSSFDPADIHGQLQFNHEHPHIKNGQESKFILDAFKRDFEVNGPSILRSANTLLKGWRRYQNHPDKRIRNRFAWEAKELTFTYPAIIEAARKWFKKKNPEHVKKMTGLLNEIKREIGIKATLAAFLGGRFAFSKLRQENKRLKKGQTYEPPTFYEMNKAMLSLFPYAKPAAQAIKHVTPQSVIPKGVILSTTPRVFRSKAR